MDAWIQPITYSVFKRQGSYTILQTEFLLNFLYNMFLFFSVFLLSFMTVGIVIIISETQLWSAPYTSVDTFAGVYPGPVLEVPHGCISQ